MFPDVRKCINRFWHVNDKGVVPRTLIKAKDVEGVLKTIEDFLDADWTTFDQPVNDDNDFTELMSSNFHNRLQETIPELYETIDFNAVNDSMPVNRAFMEVSFSVPLRRGSTKVSKVGL